MVTLVKPVKPEQRSAGILSTSLPNSNVLMLVNPLMLFNTLNRPRRDKLLQFFAFQTTLVKPVQQENASSPIEVTELPMVTVFNFV